MTGQPDASRLTADQIPGCDGAADQPERASVSPARTGRCACELHQDGAE